MIEIGTPQSFVLRDKLIAHLQLHGWYPTTMAWMWVPQKQMVMRMRPAGTVHGNRICQYETQLTPPEDCTALWGWPSNEDLLALATRAGLRPRGWIEL